jgi:hypothetical protein
MYKDKEVNNVNNFFLSNIAAHVWKIRPNDKDQILIGSFYRSPDSDEKAIQELEKSLSKIKSDKRYRNAKIFLGGLIYFAVC